MPRLRLRRPRIAPSNESSSAPRRSPRLARLSLFALIGSGLATWLVADPSGFGDALRNLVLCMIILTGLVGVHEFCHLLAALALRVQVNAFALGFGPELVGRTFGGIHWSVNALWIGGYVKLQGEAKEDGPRSFASAPTWKKVFILLVGPLSNIGLAVLLLAVMVAVMRPAFSIGQDFRAGWQILGAMWAATIDAIEKFLPVATSSPMDMPLVGLPGLIAAPGQMLTAPGGGPYMVVVLAAAISFSMGILNLLPLVPLDGGQILVAILRGALKNRYPERAMGAVMVGMFALVVAFIVTINGIDLLRTMIGYTLH